ncbi:hypothetical protein KFK09_028276 [Dendrobium nobile]|uniref:Uncharacterized protein n=1 Tax=Dendrobium nobile TaxID=94219 RepID=A0A8T3A168_DENNO|nr:hypothetical protein KFK09_028276 [Dendrobium nobile]
MSHSLLMFSFQTIYIHTQTFSFQANKQRNRLQIYMYMYEKVGKEIEKVEKGKS